MAETILKRDPDTLRLMMHSLCVQYVAVNIRTKVISPSTVRWIARDARGALIGRAYSKDDPISVAAWGSYKKQGWRIARCDISADVQQYADALV